MSKENHEDKGSVAAGLGWMILISILLFWLPVIGPVLAGFVGGRKAGGIGNGILAAILPAIILAAIIGILFGMVAPGLGAIVGGYTFISRLIQSGILIIGAIIGGATV